MVEIIIPNCRSTEEVRREGGRSPSLCPSPLLTSPDRLPQWIYVHKRMWIEEVKKQTTGLDRWGDQSEDPYLTRMFHEVTTNRFPEHYVTWHSYGGVNIPLVQGGFDEAKKYAIGPRLEMLHNQYGIGEYLVQLLDNSPLCIWTFNMLNYQANDLIQYNRNPEKAWDEPEHPSARKRKPRDFDHEIKFYPEWALRTKRGMSRSEDIPNSLPKLRNIVRACEMVIDQFAGSEWITQSDEVLVLAPIIICTWHGFEPYQSVDTNKILRNSSQTGDPGYRQSREELDSISEDQGGPRDPSWMVLKYQAENNYQVGAIETSLQYECHGADSTENAIEGFRPFLNLVRYLAHEQN